MGLSKVNRRKAIRYQTDSIGITQAIKRTAVEFYGGNCPKRGEGENIPDALQKHHLDKHCNKRNVKLNKQKEVF